LSDVGLKKMCVKHQIPTPKMGYWAKKAHGKKVPQTSLPPLSNPNLENVRIQGSALSRLSSDLQKKISTVTSATPSTKSDGVPALHKAFSNTIKKLERDKPDSSGVINLADPKYLKCSIGENSVQRTIQFLERLHAEMHRANISVVEEKGILFRFEGESLPFSITEKLDSRPHEITELEQKKLERWEKQRKSRNWFSLMDRPHIPEWDYFPSGKLIFKIDYNGYDGLRRTFSDAKIQTLESVLADIIKGLQSCAIAKKHNREEREKQAKKWELQREQQQRIQQQSALEYKRVDALKEQLSRWQHANQLRDLLAKWKQKHATEKQLSKEEVEWLDWINAYISAIDPTNQPIPRLLQLEDFSPWELRS